MPGRFSFINLHSTSTLRYTQNLRKGSQQKGKGVIFRYRVERLSGECWLMIEGPGHKKNFDFKVAVDASHGIQSGKHDEIADDLKRKAQEQPGLFEELWSALTEIYHCRELDVDNLLAKHQGIVAAFTAGAHVATLLKMVKWLFIMEDIVYWDNEGRAFLYNWLNYRCRETDARRLELARGRVRKDPTALREFLKKVGLEWVACEG